MLRYSSVHVATRFKAWCDIAFLGVEPALIIRKPELYHTLEFREQGQIIDAKERLEMQLLDFNPSTWAKKILDSANKDKPGRFKPLFATVRGSGGGKTRAWTEIRREILLNYEKVFVLAITFNSAWEVGGTDEWLGVRSPRTSYTFSVMARMLSMFFNVPLNNICHLMRNRSTGLKDVFQDAEGWEQDMIVELILWMTGRVKEYRPTVDTFVLLVDEVVRMETYIQENFVPSVKDCTSTLRQALLQEEIQLPPCEGAIEPSTLKVSLAISSLQAVYLGNTVSTSRRVIPVILPAELNYLDVVNKLWLPTIYLEDPSSLSPVLSDQEIYRLKDVS
eukprot:gene36348-biopygen3115